MATVTKPPLLDETGQKILAALTTGLANVVDAIGGDTEPKLAGWASPYEMAGAVGIAGIATYYEEEEE